RVGALIREDHLGEEPAQEDPVGHTTAPGGSCRRLRRRERRDAEYARRLQRNPLLRLGRGGWRVADDHRSNAREVEPLEKGVHAELAGPAQLGQEQRRGLGELANLPWKLVGAPTIRLALLTGKQLEASRRQVAEDVAEGGAEPVRLMVGVVARGLLR